MTPWYHERLRDYFRPKRFEFAGTDSVYRVVGIRFFKKYLPTTGDLARRMKGITQIRYRQEDPFADLYAHERKTRTLEFRHWIGMVLFVALALIFQKDYSGFDYVFVSLLFLVINVYPILLQRHTRVRILKALERFGQPSPYDSAR